MKPASAHGGWEAQRESLNSHLRACSSNLCHSPRLMQLKKNETETANRKSLSHLFTLNVFPKDFNVCNDRHSWHAIKLHHSTQSKGKACFCTGWRDYIQRNVFTIFSENLFTRINELACFPRINLNRALINSKLARQRSMAFAMNRLANNL